MKSTLILLLPAATSCVNRAFFSMDFVKTKQRKKISDGIFDDCFPHSLRDILEDVDENDVVKTFMAIRNSRPDAARRWGSAGLVSAFSSVPR